MRSLRFLGASKWPQTTATVVAPPIVDSDVFSPNVEIIYTYRIDGELYNSSHREPLLLEDSVKEYTDRVPQGTEIVVRVKPGRPDITIIKDKDQWSESMQKSNSR